MEPMYRLLLPALVFGVIFSAAVAYADTTINQVFAQLEQEYQLPAGILAKVANIESGGNPNAGSPNAAYGLFQWQPASWYAASAALYRTGPLDLSKRSDPVTSAKVTAFALADARSKTGNLIQQANIDMTLGLYMSHFLGIGGATKFLQAYIQNPSAPAASLFPREAAANQSVFGSRTLGQVLAATAQKLQVSSASINISGNFADGNGVSLAYSDADVAAKDFMPKGFVPPPDTSHTYPTTYTPLPNPSLQTPSSQLATPQLTSALAKIAGAGLTGQAAAGSATAQNAGGTQVPAVGQSSSVTGSSVAFLMVQPQQVSLGNPVVVSWSSVGMSTQTPCQISGNGQSFAQTNTGSQIIPTASLAPGTFTFTLSCTAQGGAQVQQSASVTVN